VSEVIMGCVLPAGLGQAPARQASIAAGHPGRHRRADHQQGLRLGHEGGDAGHDAIKAGSAEIVVAGGMESMTNAPHLMMGLAHRASSTAATEMLDHMAWDGLTNPYDKQPMGGFGELCSEKYGFTARDQDAFAAESCAARRPRWPTAASRTRSRR
jgi:acetyl-CoA C-acetyltransferase